MQCGACARVCMCEGGSLDRDSKLLVVVPLGREKRDVENFTFLPHPLRHCMKFSYKKRLWSKKRIEGLVKGIQTEGSGVL